MFLLLSLEERLYRVIRSGCAGLEDEVVVVRDAVPVPAAVVRGRGGWKEGGGYLPLYQYML